MAIQKIREHVMTEDGTYDIKYKETSADMVIGLPEMIPNQNLLDNSDFTSPVNQRGITTVTGGDYATIDRWAHAINTVTTTVTAQGLKVSGGDTTYNAPIVQKVVIPIDKTYTFSVCTAEGNVYSCTGSPSAKPTTTIPSGCIGILSYSGIPAVQITVTYGKTETLKWAKLEKGSIATPYVPKGYGAELAECLRYYSKSVFSLQKATASNCGITFPVPMRTSPTVALQFVGADVAPVISSQSASGLLLTQSSGTYSSGLVVASADL